MTDSSMSFAAFERSGWENPETVVAYHALAPQITTQSAQSVLDAADVIDGKRVLDMRAPRLLEEPRIAHGDGSFGRRLAPLARIDTHARP